MARKRNLFLYNIQPFLKRSKRFILFALLGLMLSLYPWLPSTAREGDPQVLNQQASELLAMGKAEAALTTWKKAEELYRDAGHQMGAIGSQINQAQALEALGHYRQSCDRILVAFGSNIIKCDKLTKDTLQEVLAKFQVADESVNFMGLQSLGNILRKIGKLEESQVVLMESKAKARSREEESQVLLSLGNTTRSLWNRVKNINEDEAKINAYNYKRAALGYYQEAARKTTSERTNIQAKLNELSLEMREEKLPDSSNIRKLLSEIQSLVEGLPLSKIGVYARINLACSLSGCDRPSEASGRKENYLLPIDDIQELLNTAIEDAKSLKDTRNKSHALGTLGMLYEQTGKLSEAESMTEKALNLAMINNAPDIAYQWQWQMGRLRKQSGDVQGAIGHYEAAFNILQGLRGDLAAFDRDTQFDFKEKVEPVYRDLVKLLLEGETPSQENLKEAREVIEGLQLAELDDYFREACTNVKQESIDDIIDKAKTPTAAIYMIVIEKRLEVIIKLPQEKELRYYRQKIPSNLDTPIKRLRKSLEDLDETDDIIDTFLKPLYNRLIGFYEEELANNGIKNLVFVMDGPLRNVPMAALYDGKGKQYLVDKYAIALAPGLQLVDTNSLQQTQLKVLAAGLSEARDKFRELPAVEKELEQIQPDLKLFNQKFTTSELENMISSRTFSILHIATHGEFSSQAEETFILAWDERLNVKKLEELLRSREKNILNPIELLVLSACETSKGDDRAALGIAGVAVRAGARSTLATLWKVADNSTAELMSQFYRNQSENMTTAEALQKAQQFLLHNPEDNPEFIEYKHPYYWAPFVLLGNWQ